MLIVEDNELVTGALRLLFEESGRRVSVAHTVADALRDSATDPPDLVLLDLKLPDGDGLEVARALAGRSVRPKAIVALTGRDEPDARRRCTDAGVTAVMLKPVPTRELLQRAAEWLA